VVEAVDDTLRSARAGGVGVFVEYVKVTMEDEECVELKVYGVRDAVFSESLLNVISFVDGGACCPLLVAPSNGYRVAISLQMPWHLVITIHCHS
jgi:hypothetical protein